MLERNPNLTSEQVREIIAKTARKEPDYFFILIKQKNLGRGICLMVMDSLMHIKP